MEDFTKFLPTLSYSHYKGQSGKVGIIGGCFEYTGAPFFAGATVLRLGGELSHIFCAKSAATAIKSYAPEQIVHPYLPDDDEESWVPTAVEKVMNWEPSIHSFVIGPGLGRNAATLSFTEMMIGRLAELKKPLVLDGDALFLVSKKPSIVNGRSNIILTPNGIEFIRLQEALGLPKTSTASDVASRLGGVTVFAKGRIDTVSNGQITKEFTFKASPRRVGGQGDLTAGAVGLFASWAPNDYFAACAAASEVVRRAAVAAFEKKKRAVITSDLIDELPYILPESWNKVIDTQ
ncbi:carbohydrate kinase [Tritrichomonas foetus]|uniref:ATP-dependent (S)-NAD(P)H-hydrate dehydratase n=1 Tax=Tritrichomonas foetus TaxID=1144522 RepID=A0A1J4KBL7_9EUKA|nr:carbohydrate kinase [Tritrichomonas foetus]|eukprot:OHT08296.1 carbohydrate kinase [Tritrichomonas foetus]